MSKSLYKKHMELPLEIRDKNQGTLGKWFVGKEEEGLSKKNSPVPVKFFFINTKEKSDKK